VPSVQTSEVPWEGCVWPEVLQLGSYYHITGARVQKHCTALQWAL